FALLTAESLGRVPRIDLVLTDVTLKGELSGRDVVERIRVDFDYGKRRLPVLVMTGDANRHNQSGLLRAGANDLVQKPIEERLLVTKVLFQLRLARLEGRYPSPAVRRGRPAAPNAWNSLVRSIRHPPRAVLEGAHWRLAAAPGDARALPLPAPAQGRGRQRVPAGPAPVRGVRRDPVRPGQGGDPRPGPVPRPRPGPRPVLLGAAGGAGAAVAGQHLQGDRAGAGPAAPGPRLPAALGPARCAAAQCGAERGAGQGGRA